MSDTKTHIEPIYYHDDVTGWHHHHSEAGVLVHLTEASGHEIDTDGTVIVWTRHGADHESVGNVDDVCLDDQCEFVGLHPETPEWVEVTGE